LYRHYDTAGADQIADYDFKGNVLSTQRWLASDYKNVVNWSSPPALPPASANPLETTGFLITNSFDALNRIKTQTAPDNSIINPVYSKRGVLQSEGLQHSQMGQLNPLINIEYDAKGQRSYVEYGNGTYTRYTYDTSTFRLNRLLTHDANHVALQDLNYTYDAVGNIIWKKDYCVPVLFYSNQMIQDDNTYTYDALYRLTSATGREAIASAVFSSDDNYDDAPYKKQHDTGINNNMAMQNYKQTYIYDAVGNILEFKHGANLGSYTRNYIYANPTNNRLTQTSIGSNPPSSIYNYNYHLKHGFLTDLPHLPLMEWNFKEELVASSKQNVGGSTIPEITYYQYDSNGKRLRKITENDSNNTPPVKKNQRIYIEGYEFYENFSGGHSTETLSLIDQGQRFVMMESSTDPNILSPITRYIHPNHQSSCTLETDEIGDIITYEEYHPFGTTSYQATNTDIKASAKRYRYTGMERDDETGLSYHNARYYIPWLGRWLNCDPIGIGDGVNVYAYCGNSPVSHTDVTGNGTEGEPKVTTKNGMPFIDLGTTISKTTDTATLRAAGGGFTIDPAAAKKASMNIQQEKTAQASNDALAKIFKTPSKTETTKSKEAQFNAVTPEMAQETERVRGVMAREKYFEGMSDFNRGMITNPVFQETSKAMLFAGTGGLIGAALPGISAGLGTGSSFLGQNGYKIIQFSIDGSLNAGSNVLGQAAFNGGFENVDYADAGIAFALNKPTFTNAFFGAGLATGLDLKPQGDPFFFGIGGGSKTSKQIGFDFAANLGINLLNNKVATTFNNPIISGATKSMEGSSFITKGLPFISNSITFGGQTLMGNLLFPAQTGTIINASQR